MGYRSDVKIITTKEGWEKLKEAEEKAQPEQDWGLYLTDERTSLLCDGKYVLFEIEHVKWYKSDPEVAAIIATLLSFDGIGIPYRYVRVGEDYSDNDCWYSDGDDWQKYKDMPGLWVKREIEVEY